MRCIREVFVRFVPGATRSVRTGGSCVELRSTYLITIVKDFLCDLRSLSHGCVLIRGLIFFVWLWCGFCRRWDRCSSPCACDAGSGPSLLFVVGELPLWYVFMAACTRFSCVVVCRVDTMLVTFVCARSSRRCHCLNTCLSVNKCCAPFTCRVVP